VPDGLAGDIQVEESAMNATVKVIGLDIAKNVFVAVGLDSHGKIVLKRSFSRAQVLCAFANMATTAIGIESCAGSHYWARKLIELGHEVKLIAAQHTRAYVSGNKNDANDAAAIAEARSRHSTKYVPINTCAQQDVQMLHRARSALMAERNALINRLRAFAGEYGQVFAQGVTRFRVEFAAWIGSQTHGLSEMAVSTFTDLVEQLDDKGKRIDAYDARLQQVARSEPRAQALMQVPGIGPLTATAVLASVADARHFASGRDFAANLGLVPREHSSGGKQRLYGITKRGDAYLRTLLIHGARSALRCAGQKQDRILRWAVKLQEKKGVNVAAVALAHKMARIAWALLAHGRFYAPNWSKTTSAAPSPSAAS
jgi:transposase